MCVIFRIECHFCTHEYFGGPGILGLYYIASNELRAFR